MKLRKSIAMLLCAATIAGLLAGCGGSSTPAASTPAATTPSASTPATSGEPQYKEEIIIAMADEFYTIDPMASTAESNQIVQDCTHDLLTDTNLDTMQNEGELVESWEMLATDHWRFKLKEGVKFHDGTILNVDDVFFTFERGASQSTTSSYIAKMESYTKIDDLTFEVKLVNGDVDFNYTFAANSLAILSKEAFESMPEEEAVAIGTGPWKFVEYVPGDYVTLERFEECTLYDVPNTKKLTFRMIPEAASRMIALENGEVDVIMSPAATDYSRLSETEGLQLLTEDGRTQHFIAFNMESPNPLMTNDDFRMAVACGIDKDEMMLAAWDGYARMSTSIMCRDMGYYADIEGIAYDPDKAAELFQKCGAVGQTVSIVTSDADHRVKMAENLQAQLAKYGVNSTVEFMQNSALTELNTGDGKTNGVEITIVSWTPGKNADYMFRNPLYSTGGRNYAHFKNAEMDALIDAAAGETDTTKRAEMYKELQERITCEFIPWVPIAQHTIAFGAVEGLTGAKLHPGLVHQFKEVELIVG